MFIKKSAILTWVLIVIPTGIWSTDFKHRSKILWAFWDYSDNNPKKYVSIGYVESLSRKTDKDLTSQNDYTHIAYVRLYEYFDIRPGDDVYFINDRNIIVATSKVIRFIKTTFMGYSIIVKGNLYTVFPGYTAIILYKDYRKYERALAYKLKGDASREDGDWDRALLFYKEALSIDKNYPEAAYYIGLYYYNKKQYRFSKIFFELAYKNRRRVIDKNDLLNIYKRLVITYIKIAKFGYEDGDSPAILYPKALSIINEAIKLAPNFSILYFYRAMIYLGMEKDDKAKEDLEIANRLNPNIYEVNMALGKWYYRKALLVKREDYGMFISYLKTAYSYFKRAAFLKKDDIKSKRYISFIESMLNR